jgi:hypothetical protein
MPPHNAGPSTIGTTPKLSNEPAAPEERYRVEVVLFGENLRFDVSGGASQLTPWGHDVFGPNRESHMSPKRSNNYYAGEVCSFDLWLMIL